MAILGVIPARMAASRFPGKPLKMILGKPMIYHVYKRAALFQEWDKLCIATPDIEIAQYCESEGIPFIMTSSKHIRCLDRVAEASMKVSEEHNEDDIIVCVQGDEPLVYPEMISEVVNTCQSQPDINATVLGMEILEEEQFLNKNTVKIVHDLKFNLLYSSRAPIPYCERFSPEIKAKRIYGIFAFRRRFLVKFNSLPESPLEKAESCDSNRIPDNGYHQVVTPFRFCPSFSVDSPQDIEIVEKAFKNDPYVTMYLN